jgi:hypothetical protein
VDIHNHWLRQEAVKGRISVKHISTPSKDMIADGLMKALLKDEFSRFLAQIGLIDIAE